MKPKSTILLLALMTLFGCKEKLSEEYYFFGNRDLRSGDYKLIVTEMEGAWIEDFSNFYIDDVETLERMQEQWVFKYKASPMPCGFGYNIRLVDEDKTLEEKAVNVDCEYMTGWIFFPRNYLTDHVQSFKRMNKTLMDVYSE